MSIYSNSFTVMNRPTGITHTGRFILKSGRLGIVQYLLAMVVEVLMFRLVHRALMLFILLCLLGIASAEDHPMLLGSVVTNLSAPTILDITTCE